MPNPEDRPEGRSIADERPVQVVAPADIRDYEPAPLPAEPRKRLEFRRRLFKAILGKGGY